MLADLQDSSLPLDCLRHSEKEGEVFLREICVFQDAFEGLDLDRPSSMNWNRSSPTSLRMNQNHVTSTLTAENESSPFESPDGFAAGDPGRLHLRSGFDLADRHVFRDR